MPRSVWVSIWGQYGGFGKSLMVITNVRQHGNFTLVVSDKKRTPLFIGEIHAMTDNHPSKSIRFTARNKGVSEFLIRQEDIHNPSSNMWKDQSLSQIKDRTTKLWNKLKHLLQPKMLGVFLRWENISARIRWRTLKMTVGLKHGCWKTPMSGNRSLLHAKQSGEASHGCQTIPAATSPLPSGHLIPWLQSSYWLLWVGNSWETNKTLWGTED